MATILFWVGVGLAPVAASLLLIGESNGPLRVAAVLAIVAVVLIGLSITLRADAESVRLDLEERLLQEIDELRAEFHRELATVVSANRQAVGEQFQPLRASVEALRSRLDADQSDPVVAAPRADAARPAVAPAEASGSGSRADAARVGVARAAVRRESARHPVQDPVRDQPHDPVHGPVRAASGRSDASRPDDGWGESARGPVGPGPTGSAEQNDFESAGHQQDGYPDGGPDREYGYDRHSDSDHHRGRSGGPGVAAAAAGSSPPPSRPGQRSGVPSSGAYGMASGPRQSYQPGPAPGGRAGVPGAGPPRPPLAAGVVRHTETVHVTTRQTIVGPAEGDSPDANVYGSGGHQSAGHEGGGHLGGTGYSGRGNERNDEWSGEPSPGRRSAEAEGDPWAYQRPRNQPGGEGPHPRPYDRDEEGPGPDDTGEETYWADVRAGDRWASVRDDERGREVRMGERRAAMRTDESGTELRVQDRWAAMRQDESGRAGGGRGESRGDGGRRSAGRRAEGGWSEGADRYGGAAPASADHGADSGYEPWREPGWERGESAALPAGGVEPPASWSEGWADPEPERARGGRRRRDDAQRAGQPATDESSPRAGGARRAAPDHSADRWS